MITELYRFRLGSTYFTYTSGKLSKTFEGHSYIPITITRSALVDTENSIKSEISVKFDANNSFAKSLVYGIPEDILTLDLIRNDVIIWSGRVLSTERDEESISLKCSNVYATRLRQGLFASISLTCRHTLYSRSCGVTQSLYKIQYNITATSNIITIAGLAEPEDYFTGGIAIINGQTRTITKQTATTIKLDAPFTGTQTGLIDLYPGCDLQEATCRDKFNLEGEAGWGNILNFGGCSRIPTKNPFGPSGLF